MTQGVKDLALLQWPGLLLWCGLDPWPRNFPMLQVQWKKKKKKRKKEKKKTQSRNKSLLDGLIQSPLERNLKLKKKNRK